MLKSSLRHVARSPSTHPGPARPPLSSPITASFSSRSHQRRHSSSKPPIPPNDGTRNIPASSVKTVGTPRSKEPATERSPAAEQSSTTDVRIPKRKIARQKAIHDGSSQWTKNMPSVPSTQHLSIDGTSQINALLTSFTDRQTLDVAVSSFFSLHRPMSVTNAIPNEATPMAVDAIFTPNKHSSRQSPGPQDVIYTIASAVQHLESNIAQQQQNPQSQKSEPRRTDITTALTQHHNHHATQADPNQTQHLDGQPPQINIRTPKGVQLMIQEVARHFRPYNTPPAPVPMSDADFDAREAEAAEEEQARDLEREIESQDNEQASSNKRLIALTVHENSDLRSRKFFTHKAPMLRFKRLAPDSAAQAREIMSRYRRVTRVLGDLRQQIRFPGAEAPSPIRRLRRRGYPAQKEREIKIHRPTFYAISVKRQRRLKMKKHKYKKLMRKTRNLRRRLDKL